MSDVITLARTAREQLGAALNALQAPGVPPTVTAVAETVAHAMSQLHQAESRPSDVAALAPQALQAVRQALAQLQAAGGVHPAVDQAIEAVAGSLGSVHSLSQIATAPRPAPAMASSVSPTAAQRSPVPRPQPAAQLSATQPAQIAQPLPAGNNAGGRAAPHQPVAAAPAYGAPAAPTGHGAPAGYPAPAQAYPAPAQAAYPNSAQAAYPAPAEKPQPREPAALEAAAATTGTLQVEAALGAHSTTNFYKGLSGNDVIDSGGIFVATYNIPAIGQVLQLTVSMPGGYEFEAKGVVKWCRDAPQNASMVPDAPPGFGAQFTELTPEAKQLVYRYVRNREPLFHDDL